VVLSGDLLGDFVGIPKIAEPVVMALGFTTIGLTDNHPSNWRAWDVVIELGVIDLTRGGWARVFWPLPVVLKEVFILGPPCDEDTARNAVVSLCGDIPLEVMFPFAYGAIALPIGLRLLIVRHAQKYMDTYPNVNCHFYKKGG
jgi:hypothetical protein